MHFLKVTLVLCGLFCQQAVSAATGKPVKALAILSIADAGIRGNITFNQASCTEPTHVSIEIEGLTPGHHGFHIHELGNLAGGCASTGSHYNPESYNHGGRDAEVRHVGDLGNILADVNGIVRDTFSDNLISLMGPNSIVGRAVVAHAFADDYGQGGDLESTKTGNAGARLACGVIGLAEGSEGPQPVCDGASSIGIFLSTIIVTMMALTGFNCLFV